MEPWWIQAQIRDQGRCVYCNFDLYEKFETYWTIQADHQIPQHVLSKPEFAEVLRNHDVFRDGPVIFNSVGNCVTACTFCNQLKKGWLPDNWMQMSREGIIASNRERLSRLRIRHELEFVRRAQILSQNAR